MRHGLKTILILKALSGGLANSREIRRRILGTTSLQLERDEISLILRRLAKDGQVQWNGERAGLTDKGQASLELYYRQAAAA